jgi:catechol 2,3-dioxygenase-like lactoylglutathione lyase family enzyme
MQIHRGRLIDHVHLRVANLDSAKRFYRVLLAFQTDSRAQVQAFHAAALRAGGRDNGAPGERSHHPGYYAAFVLDPDGNNIEAVHHGPAKKSAESIVITPAGE